MKELIYRILSKSQFEYLKTPSREEILDEFEDEQQGEEDAALGRPSYETFDVGLTVSDDELESPTIEPPKDGLSHGEIEIVPSGDSGASSHRSTRKPMMKPWEPTGNTMRDFWYFCGPGWLVCIAYVDPGNYQADIQAGATSRYYLLFAVWWTSILSVYVQILCVRLAYYAQVTLAEAQAKDAMNRPWLRYLNWFIAEFSTVITDLPEVIGIGIACHYFFGWPYYVGVLLSLITTMVFLATMHLGMQVLELIIFVFVGIMSVALFIEMDAISPNPHEYFKGWLIGFLDVKSDDVFAIAGILGAVVMPHNLYLHTAAVQSRRVKRTDEVVTLAVKYCSIEPILPIVVSFFVNSAIVTIAAESVYGEPLAEFVGLTDFCTYFTRIKYGCILWGIALLAAGQSSAITTTYSGQYVMDGFLKIRLPVQARAIMTRLVAITPCVIISIMFPKKLNKMVNIVNASLSFLLPFAFTPLVKYNCSTAFMGTYASKGIEKLILYIFAILVWAINAFALSARDGGFFGNFVPDLPDRTTKRYFWIIVEVCLQIFYAWWNYDCLFTPVQCLPHPIDKERKYDDDNLFPQRTNPNTTIDETNIDHVDNDDNRPLSNDI